MQPDIWLWWAAQFYMFVWLMMMFLINVNQWARAEARYRHLIRLAEYTGRDSRYALIEAEISSHMSRLVLKELGIHDPLARGEDRLLKSKIQQLREEIEWRRGRP